MSDKDHIITYVTDHKLRTSYTRNFGSVFTRPNGTQSENNIIKNNTPTYEGRISLTDRINKIPKHPQSLGDIIKTQDVKAKSLAKRVDKNIIVIKNGRSLTTTACNSMDTLSMSASTSITNNSTYCLSSLSLMSSLEGSISSISVSDKNTSIYRSAESSHMCTKATSPRLEYKVFKVTHDKGNMKVDQSKVAATASGKRKETRDILSKLDISNIMAKILKKKRFSVASKIFIIVPTSNNSGSEETSDSQKSITSHASTDNHIIAERVTLVNLDTPLRKEPTTRHEANVLGKRKKFYLQEIHTSDSSTELRTGSLQVLRKVGWRNNKYCQIAAPYNKLQLLRKTDQNFGTDTTMDRPCCCCAKISTSTFVVQNCSSSKDTYVTNVMSRKSTPSFLKGESSSRFHSSRVRTPSSTSAMLPCDKHIMCSHCSSYHVPSNGSRDVQYYFDHSPECCQPECIPFQSSEPFCPRMPLPCSCYPEYSEADLQIPYEESMQFEGRKRKKNGKQKCVVPGNCPVESVEGLSCECKDSTTVTIGRKIKICPCDDLLVETEPRPMEGIMSKGMMTDLKGSEIIDLQRQKPTQDEKKLSQTADKPITKPAGPQNVEQPSEQRRQLTSEQPRLEPTEEPNKQPILKSSQQPHKKKKKKKVTLQQPTEPKEPTEPEPKELTKPKPKELTQPEPKELTQPKPKELTQPKPKEFTQAEPKELTQPEPKEPTEPACACLDVRGCGEKKQSRKHTEPKEPTTPDCVCLDVRSFGEQKQSRKHTESKEPTTPDCACLDVRSFGEKKQSRKQTEPKEPTTPDCACLDVRSFGEEKQSHKPTETRELTESEPKEPIKPESQEPIKPEPKEPAKPEPKEPAKLEPKEPSIPEPKEPTTPDCACLDVRSFGEEKQSHKPTETRELTESEPKEPIKPESQEPIKPEPKEPAKPEPKEPAKLEPKEPSIPEPKEPTKKKKKENRKHSEQKEHITSETPKKSVSWIDLTKYQPVETEKDEPTQPSNKSKQKTTPEQSSRDKDHAKPTAKSPDSSTNCLCNESESATRKSAVKSTTSECSEEEGKTNKKGKVSKNESLRKIDPKSDTKPQPIAGTGPTLQSHDKRPPPPPVAPPEPQIVLELPPAVIPEGYLSEGIGPSCTWINPEEIMKIRSDLTVSCSGFTARKKKRKLQKPNNQDNQMKSNPSAAEIELDFEDAIRYFASLNPKRFKELMQDELQKQVDAEVYKRENEKKLKKNKEKEMKKMEKERKKAEKNKEKKKKIKEKKESVKALPPPGTPEEITDMYPETGFKFTIAGPCTPGPAGTLCFEMTQVAYMSW